MQSTERRLIQELFDRLAAVEHQRRDPEAERLIAGEMHRVPHAPYAMAQTIIAQNQALEAAARRIEELEGGAEFEDGDEEVAPGAMGAPSLGRRGSVPGSGARLQPGGGFLANAGQIALGVAGGMLIGEAAKSLLGGGSEAQAATGADSAGAAEAGNPLGEQAGAGDVGGGEAAGEAAGGGGFFDWLFGGGDAANDSGNETADSGWDDGGWSGGE